MEENFDLLAQSRANYYTKGSPVQFVRVELLKGDVSGDVAVCLSFKNITSRPMTGLAIHFRCKNRSGEVVCADQFYYQDLDTANGQVFGADDAVYISDAPIGSVEVDLGQAFYADGTTEDLSTYPRVRLPLPQKLSEEIAQKLCDRTHKEGLNVMPQVLEDGWYCACGAFHPSTEEGVWCSECGADRILLQNTLASLTQPKVVSTPTPDCAPTRMAPPVSQPAAPQADEPTRMAPPIKSSYQKPAAPENDSDMRIAEPRREEIRPYAPFQDAEEPTRYMDPQWAAQSDSYADSETAETLGCEAPEYSEPEEEELSRKDEIAVQIIRWAPPVTAVLCAITVVVGIFLR